MISEELFRYSRQLVLRAIGPDGQRKIRNSSIAIVGCGALGSHSAELLARMGVGRLKLIDRDVVELENLHRQYYTEAQAKENVPKAFALANRLAQVNSEVYLEPVTADLNSSNALSLLSDVDLVIDGTDNFETRFLLNDACLKLKKPCVFGAAIETHGMIFVVLPGGPCLRDLMDSPPLPGSVPTCEIVGVLPTVTAIVSSLQVTEALKIMLGKARRGILLFLDPWNGILEEVEVTKRADCPACVLSKFDYLTRMVKDIELCGRNAVHISSRGPVNIREINERLSHLPGLNLRLTDYTLHIRGRDFQMILFPDGRAIVKGTDPARARSLYSRYVGL